MASDSSPLYEGRKRKKKSDRAVKSKDNGAEVPEFQVDIEELTASGNSALQRGHCEEALSCFKKAFKASVQLKETRVQRACAFNLGAAYVEAGKAQKGLDFLRGAQPSERGERVADLQFNLAVAHEGLGEAGRAAGHYLQAAQLYRSQGDGASEGDTCMKMADCHILLQDWTQAAQSFQRAGESYKVAGRLDYAATALKEAGNHMLQSDDFTIDDIVPVLTECIELSDNLKDPEALGELYNDLGLSFSQLRLFQEAAECYEQALPLARDQPRRLAVVLQNLGAAHNTLGQHSRALEYHRQAASLHGSLGNRRAQGRCFCNLAYALSQLEQHEEAAENYLHALQAFRDTDDYKGQCQVCEGLGEARFQMRDLEKATLYYKQALGLLSKCKDSSSSVQERLVTKLSEALQHRLSLSTPAVSLPRSQRLRRTTQNGIGPGQPVRQTDMNGVKPGPGLQNQGLDFNQHPRRGVPNGHRVKYRPQRSGAGSAAVSTQEQRREEGAPVPDGEQAHGEATGEAGDSESLVNAPLTLLPAANRNLNNTYEQPEAHYQNQTLSHNLGVTQQSEHLYESIKARTTETKSEDNSETPLAQGSEGPPTGASHNEEATPLFRKWKSQICLVM